MFADYKKMARLVALTAVAAPLAFTATASASAGDYSERADAMNLCTEQVRTEAGEGRILVTKTKRRGGKHKFWVNKYEAGSNKREAKAFCVVDPDEGLTEFKLDR